MALKVRDIGEEWERKSILRQKGISLEQLLKKVANRFGVDSEELRSGSKVATVSKARAVPCYLGVRRHGLTAAHISKEAIFVSRAESPPRSTNFEGLFFGQGHMKLLGADLVHDHQRTLGFEAGAATLPPRSAGIETATPGRASYPHQSERGFCHL